MAYEIPILDITLPASGDLSADQFRFVSLNTSGQTQLCGANSPAVGVQQDAPSTAGQASQVRVAGVTKVVVGTGGLTAGGLVASDSSGKAVAYTAASVSAGTPERLAGSFVMGIALAAASAGDIVEVLLTHAGVSN